MTSPMDGIFPLFALNAHINSTDDIDALVEIIEKEPMKFLKNMNSYTEKELLFLFTEAGFDIIRFIYTDYYNANAQFSEGQSVFMVYEYNEDKYLAKGMGNSNNPRDIAVLRDIRCAAEFICNTISKRNGLGCTSATYFSDKLYSILDEMTKKFKQQTVLIIPFMNTERKFRTVFFTDDWRSANKFSYTDASPNDIYMHKTDIIGKPIHNVTEWFAAQMLHTILNFTGHLSVDINNDGDVEQLITVDCVDDIMRVLDGDSISELAILVKGIVEGKHGDFKKPVDEYISEIFSERRI